MVGLLSRGAARKLLTREALTELFFGIGVGVLIVAVITFLLLPLVWLASWPIGGFVTSLFGIFRSIRGYLIRGLGITVVGMIPMLSYVVLPL